MNLNKEQQWLCKQIGSSWPGEFSNDRAITRGPCDQLIPVYPRNCTKDYCVTYEQWQINRED